MLQADQDRSLLPSQHLFFLVACSHFLPSNKHLSLFISIYIYITHRCIDCTHTTIFKVGTTEILSFKMIPPGEQWRVKLPPEAPDETLFHHEEFGISPLRMGIQVVIMPWTGVLFQGLLLLSGSYHTCFVNLGRESSSLCTGIPYGNHTWLANPRTKWRLKKLLNSSIRDFPAIHGRVPEEKQQNWLVVWTSLKNISQLGLLFPIYGKIKNVPNHPEKIAFGAGVRIQ